MAEQTILGGENVATLVEEARAFLTGDARWRRALAHQISPRPHDVVLDLTCGDGALLLALARVQPRADYHGVDAIPGMAARARDRVGADARMALHDGAAGQLLTSATHVVMTFAPDMSAADRTALLLTARNSLDDMGVLHVADRTLQRTDVRIDALVRALRSQPSRAQTDTMHLMRHAGFVAVDQTGVWPTAAGPVLLHRARKR